MEFFDRIPLSGYILIAEDNKTNQILIKLLVEEFGLECEIVNDGEEAYKIYNPLVHQLILMDENMPNMNGVTAMQLIRKQHGKNTTPIISLTANVMEGDKERFISLGMDDYIGKPIDENELYNVLKYHLLKSQ